MTSLRINKLVIVGVGLIGGSFALALKKARAVKHVVGVGRTRKNLNAALKLGVIDEASQDIAKAVRDADMVLIGTPVGQMAGDVQLKNQPFLLGLRAQQRHHPGHAGVQ